MTLGFRLAAWAARSQASRPPASLWFSAAATEASPLDQLPLRPEHEAMRIERAARRRAIVVVALVLATTGGGLALLALSGHLAAGAVTPGELALTIGLTGSLILWHRPSNRIGMLLALTGVLFGMSVLAGGVLEYAGGHTGVPEGLRQAALAWAWLTPELSLAWALLLLWFPDGRFTSRGWKRFFAAAVAASLVLGVSGYLVAARGGRLPALSPVPRAPASAGGPLAASVSGHLVYLVDAFSLSLPLVSLVSLAQRYRRSGAIARQQIKWLVAGAAVAIAGSAIASLIQDRGGAAHALGVAVLIVVTPLPITAAAAAILRYHLWEIDVVVSRAVIYVVLWIVLSAVLLVPALAAGLLVGGPGALAAVGLALLVTLAFQPARARLERIVERVVYRDRRRGYEVLTRFGHTLRAATGAGDVAPQLAQVVRSGLGASWAGVWFHVSADGAGALRSVAATGIEPGPSVLLSAETSTRLLSSPAKQLTGDLPAELRQLWPGTTAAAAVPLVAGQTLVGVLACGQRPGDPLGERDHELLGQLARESALALRNLRLEAQLRERLTEIEQQADELRRSRQRLVGVQDEERRRIERDLHDGVQQQLVALAARLRRAATATPPDARLLLAQLAPDAEEAVFALQDLARGIFPSVLADQGLAAALRTHAARMPMAIRVEAEPHLAGHRFDRELEAAFYFVALEAMANAQKHASGAAVTVSLRSADAGRRVVLEVHDDGPGFRKRPASTGTGLQNMQDRLAAVGGELTIDSRPGAGTWIHAEALVASSVVALQPDSASLS
jgi:signal transduction histidine kinase